LLQDIKSLKWYTTPCLKQKQISETKNAWKNLIYHLFCYSTGALLKNYKARSVYEDEGGPQGKDYLPNLLKILE